LLSGAIGRHPCRHTPPVEQADRKLLIDIIVGNRFEYLPDCRRPGLAGDALRGGHDWPDV
jgi:hypothetical protein